MNTKIVFKESEISHFFSKEVDSSDFDVLYEKNIYQSKGLKFFLDFLLFFQNLKALRNEFLFFRLKIFLSLI